MECQQSLSEVWRHLVYYFTQYTYIVSPAGLDFDLLGAFFVMLLSLIALFELVVWSLVAV